MFKPGVWRIGSLVRGSRRPFWLARRNIAITLYEELEERREADRDELQEWVLLQFPTRSGTFKRTYRRRFPRLDGLILETLSARSAGRTILRVHDAGVSDGRTTYDLWQVLRQLPVPRVELLATDLLPEVTLVSTGRGGLSVAIDEEGAVLQVIRPPFVLNVPTPENPFYYPINALARRLLLAHSVPALLERYRQRSPTLRVRKLPLVHRRLRDLVASVEGVSLARHDVLDPMEQEFDLVRVMNLLNRDYFDDRQLGTALGNIHASLTEGGLLVAGRDQGSEATLEAAIYERRGHAFTELVALDRAPEIHEMILAGSWP